VTRFTRRDAIYEEIEPLYDRWTMASGAAVLDPLPEAVAGERIEPFELPKLARRVEAITLLAIKADRTTECGDHARDGIAMCWQRRLKSIAMARTPSLVEHKDASVIGSA